MLKIFAIALVILNVFAVGQMHAEAHVGSTDGMPHHNHSTHQSNTESAEPQHHGEADISYNC